MRIHGDLEQAIANLSAGRERRRIAVRKYIGQLLRPPSRGTLLRKVHVEDCFAGTGYTLEIRQGARRNGIEVWRYGRRVVTRNGTGFDALFREIRRDWKLRWIVEG